LYDGAVAPLKPQPCTQLAHAREVLCYSLWLNIIGHNIAEKTQEYFLSSKRYPYFDRIKTCLSGDVLELANDLKDKIYTSAAKERIVALIEPMNVETSFKRLNNAKFLDSIQICSTTKQLSYKTCVRCQLYLYLQIQR
jgi:hypothetical protein